MVVEAEIRYSAMTDPVSWIDQYSRDEVPDLLPYGLDRLKNYGVHPRVRIKPSRAKGIVRRMEARLEFDWSHGSRHSNSDVLLCWDERTGVPASMFSNKPVVTGVIWASEHLRPLVTHALRRAAGVWVSSSGQLSALRKVGLSSAVHIPMGVDSQFFAPKVGKLDSRAGKLVSVGNDRHRDYETLVQAVQLVDFPGLTLRIISSHPVTRIDPRIELTSHASHVAVREAYESAALVVISLQSNLHVSGVTAALESMACGRPVIISDTPGMRDYVIDGITGILVPPGDSLLLAKAIKSLLMDPDRAEEMGAAARDHVLSNFTTEHQAERISRLVAGLS